MIEAFVGDDAIFVEDETAGIGYTELVFACRQSIDGRLFREVLVIETELFDDDAILVREQWIANSVFVGEFAK